MLLRRERGWTGSQIEQKWLNCEENCAKESHKLFFFLVKLTKQQPKKKPAGLINTEMLFRRLKINRRCELFNTASSCKSVDVHRRMRIMCIYAAEQTRGLKCVWWVCLKASICIRRQADRGLTSVHNPQASAGSLEPVNHRAPRKRTKADKKWTFQNPGERLQPFRCGLSVSLRRGS